MAAFFRTSGRPENAARVRYLFDNGLQTPVGVELDLGRAVGEFASSLDIARPFPGRLRFGQGDDAAPTGRSWRPLKPHRVGGLDQPWRSFERPLHVRADGPA